MRYLNLITILGLLLFSCATHAQTEAADDVLELGALILQPQVSVLGAYEDRVEEVAEDEFEGDFYYETGAGLSLRNRPARYDFTASAYYGYRTYSDYTTRDDDFYSGAVSLTSDEGKLNWGADATYRKLLNYDTSYDPATGDDPDSILTDEDNKRTQARVHISYDQAVSDRVSIVPEYSLWYYNQEFSSGNRAEWIVHQVSLPVQYLVTDKTTISAGIQVSKQENKDEDGIIGTLYAGAKGEISEKTIWSLYLGVSAADYDESGSEVGGVSRGRLSWQATEKVNVYVFGGNRYVPGYSGGAARMVYRAGYGASWTVVEPWVLSATGFHNLEEEVGGDSGSDRYEGTRSFYTVSATYSLPRWAEISFVGEYINDEEKEDNVIASIELVARY